MSHKKNIILFTAKHSDNLGDGVIADCTQKIISLYTTGHPINILSLDISGREKTQITQTKSLRTTLKNYAIQLPNFVKTLIVLASWNLHGKNRLTKLLNNSGSPLAIVFGGGQLILDNNLSFPLKLREILNYAQEHRIIVCFFGCGVGKQGTFTAERMFKKIFSHSEIHSVLLRDRDSVDKFNNRYSNKLIKAEQTFDSALFASETYKIPFRDHSTIIKRIGLGVTNPHELRAGSRNPFSFDANEISKKWIDLAIHLNTNGYEVTLYTNGSGEDEEFKLKLLNALNKHKISAKSRPKTPSELVAIINSFDAIISHRLHSSIIATSIGVPSIGLNWDDKVKSFYSEFGLANFCLDGERFSAIGIAELLTHVSQDEYITTRRIALEKAKSKILENAKKLTSEIL